MHLLLALYVTVSLHFPLSDDIMLSPFLRTSREALLELLALSTRQHLRTENPKIRYCGPPVLSPKYVDRTPFRLSSVLFTGHLTVL